MSMQAPDSGLKLAGGGCQQQLVAVLGPAPTAATLRKVQHFPQLLVKHLRNGWPPQKG